MPDAGRVIAGTARSIRLESPGSGTRPLADRVKQTLFAILEPDLPGSAFLDLFAGSGAAGIEALSRGAAHATFVERDGGAIRTIHANLERTGFANVGRATIVKADAIAWLAGHSDHFEIVFVDPPYDEPATLVAAIEALGPSLTRDARVVAKHFWRARPPAVVGLLASERERRFGETSLTFYRRRDAELSTEGA
jgi:16S rRNA (guanine966-N2)-methyltransferase